MGSVGAWSASVYIVTCPKCGAEFQHRRPGNRARVCPKCGQAGAREDFAHRPLESAPPPPATGGDPPPAPPARPARKLRGAAKRAHEAKAAGRVVKIGAVAIGAKGVPRASDDGRERRTRPRGFLDALRRVI